MTNGVISNADVSLSVQTEGHTTQLMMIHTIRMM